MATETLGHRRAGGEESSSLPKVMAVTSLGGFLAFLDATIVNIAFPDLRREFSDSSLATLSWTIGAYNVVFAALLVPAGRLADALGARRVFLWGLTLFSVASVLCAVAPGVGALIAARALQAAGAAVLVPVSLALLLPHYPPERQAQAVGQWGAIAALAAALGPTLGGALVDFSDWRLVFWINVPLGAAGLLAAARWLPPDAATAPRTSPAVPDLVGTAALVLAIGLLALGLVQSEDWGWDDPFVLGALAAGAALVPAVVRRASRHPNPAYDPALLREPAMRIAGAATLLFGAGFYGFILCNVLFLTGVWGYDLLHTGLATLPGPLTTMLVAGPAGRLADRVGHLRVIVPGALLFAGGVLWIVLRAGSDPAWATEWLPGAAITGAGVGLAWPTMSSAALAAAPAARLGTAAALNAAARQIGAVLGVALIVTALGTSNPDFDAGWILCAACGVLSAVVALPLSNRLRRLPPAQSPVPK